MYQHTINLYNALEEQADDDGMFVGSVTEVYRSLGLSLGYYSNLFGYLKDSGCIVQVQRGFRGQNSVIHLIKRPTPDEFVRDYTKPLTNPHSLATLSDRVKTLEDQMPNIDLTQWIASIELKLSQLENDLNELEVSVDNLPREESFG